MVVPLVAGSKLLVVLYLNPRTVTAAPPSLVTFPFIVKPNTLPELLLPVAADASTVGGVAAAATVPVKFTVQEVLLVPLLVTVKAPVCVPTVEREYVNVKVVLLPAAIEVL